VTGKTRGSESGRGDRVSVRDNTFIGTTDFDLEQSPVGGAGRAGTSGATQEEAELANDKRERPGDESGLAEPEGKPLKRESCTWQWDEIGPQATRGVTRRGRVKRRGRNEGSVGNCRVVDSGCGCRDEEQTLRRRVLWCFGAAGR
jgi:hypothetical protein